MPEVEQVFPFENRGKEIGVTLQHPHGQIYAYPFVTPRTATHARPGRPSTASAPAACCCATSSTPSGPTARGSCSRASTGRPTCPYAARWPVEVHLAPHRDVPDLPALDDAERDELAARLPRPAAAAGPLLRRRPTAGRCGCPTSPAGTRRRPARAATWPGCTCSSSRCCARRAS